MSRVRVGVIGVGRMGERHCRVYSNLRGVELVGVCDTSSARAETVARVHGTKCFTEPAQLLDQVDAVSIATTTPHHFHLTMQAIGAGANVLVEKPITETAEQGEKVVAATAASGRIVQMGHIERFNPAYLELKNVIAAGMRVVAIQVRRLSPFDTSNTDVDVVRDLMIHDLDLVTDLVGASPATLFALGRSLTTNVTDHAVANLSFADGPISTLCASRITEQKVRVIEVVVDGAYIEADLLGKQVTIHRRTLPHYEEALYRQESVIEQIHVPSDEPLMLELRHFVNSVRENRPTSVPAADGLRALQLAEQICAQLQQSEPAGPPRTEHPTALL
jgi:predicted dehydrogenase